MTTLLCWLVMVFILSVVPVRGPELDIPAPDKLAHTVIYAVTALLMYVVMKERGWVRRRGVQMTVVLAVVGATAYGALMEGAQAFAPHREPGFWDAAFNAAGAVLAGVFLIYKERAVRR